MGWSWPSRGWSYRIIFYRHFWLAGCIYWTPIGPRKCTCKSNKIQDKYKFRLVYMSCTCTTYMYVPTIKPSTFYHFHLFVWIRTIMYTCACTPVCGTLCVCVVHTDTVPGGEKGQISYMCTKNDLVLGTQYALRSLTKSLTKSFIDCHLMIYVGYLNCTYIQVRYRSTGM